MAKATQIPNSVNFPRFHQVCDHCGKAASWHAGQATRTARETCLGAFKYQICFECGDKIEAMPRKRREHAYTRAMVRHAMHYSADYGNFVASWFGVSTRGMRTIGV